MAKAVVHLNPSKLSRQRELMDNVTLMDGRFEIFIPGKGMINVGPMVSDGDVERTIDGASTVTVTLIDDKKDLLESGWLTKHTDINIDGLYFRLAKVRKQGELVSLIFMDREVALMRGYNTFRKANRDDITRAEFVLSLVREVRELHIRTVIPELHKVQPIEDTSNQDASDIARGGGFADGADIKVKGQAVSNEQKQNINTVLSVGTQMGVPGPVLVAAIETITVESSAINLKGGDRDSVGLFQQRNFSPWTDKGRNRMNPQDASRTFYEQAMKWLDAHPTARTKKGNILVTPGTIAQAVQISAYPDRYDQYDQEARHTVAAWTGNDPSAIAGVTPPDAFIGSSGGDYQFTRGEIDAQTGNITRENTWKCVQRLADEVQWRAFMVSGTFYFISDERLFQSRPRMVIDETTEGVQWIDGDFDIGKKSSEVTVTCTIAKWTAPPGSVVQIKNMGPFNGRWIVNNIRRGLFDWQATILMKKPQEVLPEPAAQQGASGSLANSGEGSIGFTNGRYPLEGGRGKFRIIGRPYQGTHLDFGNWESDNAIDIAAPKGTPVLAVFAGRIGPQLGPLSSSNPQLLGERLHLVTSGNEFYYAHLSRIDVRVGQHVEEGQRLGLSGVANGVAHLHLGQKHGDPGVTVGDPSPGYRDRHLPG